MHKYRKWYKKIDIINESINKSNDNINSEIKYNPEQELNEFLNIIKSFGEIDFVGKRLPVISDKFNISQNPLIISPNNDCNQQKVTMDPYPIKKNEKKFII